MKTNNVLTVAILGGNITAHHKTGMIDVNTLIDLGNEERRKDGKKPYTVPRIRQNRDIAKFAEAVREQVDNGHYRNYDLPEELLFSTGRGRGSTTLAFLPIALKIASVLSPRFEAELYRVFIENQLLILRDDGGDSFKAINVAIAAHLPNREGKNNIGVYIQLAKKIREKIFTEDELIKGGKNIWNSKYATHQNQQLRTNYENKLINILQLGLVRDWEHLKELLKKLDN